MAHSFLGYDKESVDHGLRQLQTLWEEIADRTMTCPGCRWLIPLDRHMNGLIHTWTCRHCSLVFGFPSKNPEDRGDSTQGVSWGHRKQSDVSWLPWQQFLDTYVQ